MKRKHLLALLMVVVMCIVTVQPVSAATKYTKTEKKLAQSLANFQDSELVDPDSFKIRHIYKVNYTLNKENYNIYKLYDLLDSCKTIKWKVEYTAKNKLGGTVKDTVYISSTYYSMTDVDFEEYTDKTNYSKRSTSKKFVDKIKKLTKKYYKEL